MRDQAVAFVDRLRAEHDHYYMTPTVRGTLFTDCFALFLRHLLQADAPAGEREAIRDRILAAQDPQSGLWLQAEAPAPADPHRKADYQLTAFAVSALALLGAAPRHPLRFIAQWQSQAQLEAYLDRLPWHAPSTISGNQAMFVGILLTYDGSFLEQRRSLEALDVWFDWHDRHSRPTSGFWNAGRMADWYIGMVGAAHQYVLYHFFDRQPPHLERAVDHVLAMQLPDGRFWPLIGSGSCYELDAVQILLVGHKRLPHRREAIAQACRRAAQVVLASRNADGGFCWAKRRWFDWRDMAAMLTATPSRRANLWLLERQIMGHLRRRSEKRATVWARGVHAVDESSLFDTWFRLLTLAKIAQVAEDADYRIADWQPLNTPNWGYF